MMDKKCNKKQGFTLIELMIVVAIVGILAAIAYPSYVDSIRKSRRVDAKSELMALAQKQEAYYVDNVTYTADMTKLGYGAAGWNDVPVGAADQYYQVRVQSADASSYQLQAQPKPGTDQVNDEVEMFELYATGVKRKKVGGAWSNTWK